MEIVWILGYGRNYSPAGESRYYRFLVRSSTYFREAYAVAVGGLQYRHSLGTGRGFAIEIPIWINRSSFLHRCLDNLILPNNWVTRLGLDQPPTQPLMDRPVTPRPAADGVTLRSRTLPQTVYDTGNPYLFPAGGYGQIPVEVDPSPLPPVGELIDLGSPTTRVSTRYDRKHGLQEGTLHPPLLVHRLRWPHQ